MGAKPRRLPMEKREDKVKLSTTFSKRRVGLFNKVSELILLCDAKAAVFVSYPSSKKKFSSVGYPSVDSVLDLAIKGGGNAWEGEKEKRIKKAALSMFNDLEAGKTALKNLGTEEGGPFSWGEFSRELDEMANQGDDLKAMVDLLRKIKKKAESKLRNLVEPKLELTAGMGSGSCNQKQNPEIGNNPTDFGSNDLWGWSYQHETQPAESDSGFTAGNMMLTMMPNHTQPAGSDSGFTTGNGMLTMMPNSTQFDNSFGEFTYQNHELQQVAMSRSNQDEMNLQAQVFDPSNAAALQGYHDFNVDDLLTFDLTFDPDTLLEFLN